MPEWYVRAVGNRHNAAACIAFTKDFLAAPHSERAEVVKCWDPTLEWELPSPWRLACTNDAPGSSTERIRTDLLFQALGLNDVDTRESIMGIAVIYNSCTLADLAPGSVFEEIAEAVGGAAARALRDFASRDPEDQSMAAFMLTAVANPDGGYEIRADW